MQRNVASPAASPDGTAKASEALDFAPASAVRQSAPAKTPAGQVIPEEEIPDVVLEHDPGTVLVRFDEGVTPAEATAAIDASRCTVPQSITEQDIANGFAVLAVADDYDVEHAMVQLGMLPELEGAQPDFVYRLLDVGDDAFEGRDYVESGKGADSDDARSAGEQGADLVLTSARNTSSALDGQTVSVDDPRADEQWALESVHAYEAWEKVTTDGSVTVAVLDNGFQTDHEDLQERVVGAYNAVTDTEGAAAVAPINGFSNTYHGTHVAGIVAAQANNGKGIAGVSYNANIMPIQVFEQKENSLEATTETLVKAYAYLMDNASSYNVKVVNLSVGVAVEEGYGLSSYDYYDSDISDYALRHCVQEAYDAGILTVCSAGNEATASDDSAYLNFPSDWLDCALGVIALQNGNPPTRSVFGGSRASNFNMAGQRTKDIAAPGSSILSTSSGSETSYATKQGTSMAAPCVAGVAALVYAANPELSAQAVSEIICNNATDLGTSGWDREFGYGEVNAAAAVQAADVYLEGKTSLLVGGSVTLVPSTAGDWAWSSSDTSIARVSQDGVVTGLGPGEVKIKARLGEIEAVKLLTVYDVTLSGPSALLVGADVRLGFSDNPDTALWLIGSEDKSIATTKVNQDGTVSVFGISEGTTAVTATLSTDPDIFVRHEVSIERIDLASTAAQIIWPDLEGFAYTGEAYEPKPTGVRYTLSDGSVMELTDSDITWCSVSYKGNVAAGTATITVTGTGPCKGTAHQTFAIAQAKITDEMVDAIDTQAYDEGNPVEPHPLVRFGGIELREGVDYEVDYSDNKVPGTATATITGKGNFTGSVSTPFTISATVFTPKTIELAIGSCTYTGYPLEPAVAVRFLGAKLEAGTDYTVAYANNVRAGTASVVVQGIGAYAGSVAGSFTIDKAKLAAPEAVKGLVYTGTIQTGIKGGAGYVLTGITSARDAGTYNVIAALEDPANHVWADGTSAARAITWTIAQAPLSSATITGVPDRRYCTGKAIEPSVSAKLGAIPLVAGTDFTVSYGNNVSAGKARVTVTGIGNCRGTVTKMFKIVKRKNTMTVATKTKTLKARTLANGKRQVAPIIVRKARGEVTYRKVSGSKRLTVGKKTGKITVKKGTKAGTYRIKVRIRAAGTDRYKVRATYVIATIKVH